MVQGKKSESKQRISISLHSHSDLVDRRGPIEGFEVFKLSNHDLSLASPNPLLPPGDSLSYSVPTLLHSLLGHRNAIVTVVFTLLVNIIVHKMWETDSSEKENEPSARVKQPCRRFSLAEMQSATDNFHSRNIVGRGGFGDVFRGFMDNGREIVAIKRLKQHSSQGEQQFWTEIEMLSELRHVKTVTFIPSQQINSTIVNSGRQGGRKSMMLQISLKHWQRDAFGKTRNPSKQMHLVGTSVTAPIEFTNVTLCGRLQNNDGMIFIPSPEWKKLAEPNLRVFSLTELEAATEMIWC
ncbi:probable receptor-like protein kinase At5g38990 [Salvia splendens]|uniref:probable receptor-like protein kinase At5g38990 n=1 Tax=Salvia splendens TaxID=180675 RepID=UPI001C264BE5|nr:probable receptor-like protein kinase At5g38990 [Salvia splendens]XP_042035987.1 probable receptor-like protein kinase At5g38990 [Salvia splendens]XP_042035988.1 probable receptor-like protein kinase At5g38990 [Salvia splendens]XP_042035990.1 probable receptor-like protein kinase At5g38990 [Salvia splendens]